MKCFFNLLWGDFRALYAACDKDEKKASKKMAALLHVKRVFQACIQLSLKMKSKPVEWTAEVESLSKKAESLIKDWIEEMKVRASPMIQRAIDVCLDFFFKD